jgi:16S rRNA (cytidine1402-2'-O)-methyltransferase
MMGSPQSPNLPAEGDHAANSNEATTDRASSGGGFLGNRDQAEGGEADRDVAEGGEADLDVARGGEADLDLTDPDLTDPQQAELSQADHDEFGNDGVDGLSVFVGHDDVAASPSGREAQVQDGIPGVAKAGTLVLVATPIGNLGDLSDRARTALREASAIAAEDTRHTRKLLSSQGISGVRLLAVHEHNEQAATNGIVSLLARGETIALVTDAGTPGISDPGMRVVAGVIAAGHEVVCVPGPAAFVAALVVSGLPTERFVFESFLPRSGAGRQAIMAEIAVSQKTTVFYEAPNRVVRTLRELVAACGDGRAVSVSRELTKRFEQTWRGPVAQAVAYFAEHEPKGEFVITVGPAPKPDVVVIDDETIRQLLRAHIAVGKRNREAIDAVTAETGLPRKHVYAVAVSRPD